MSASNVMTSTQALKAVLGLKEESVIIATDSGWLLAVQDGFNDKETLLKAAIPATCFEFGFENKTKLSAFLKGEANEAMLRVGEAYLHIFHEEDDLGIDFGRVVGGYDTIFDTRIIEAEKKSRFLELLKKHIVNF